MGGSEAPSQEGEIGQILRERKDARSKRGEAEEIQEATIKSSQEVMPPKAPSPPKVDLKQVEADMLHKLESARVVRETKLQEILRGGRGEGGVRVSPAEMKRKLLEEFERRRQEAKGIIAIASQR